MDDQWVAPEGFLRVFIPFAGRYIDGFNPAHRYEFLQHGSDTPRTFALNDLPPTANIHNLYVRLSPPSTKE